MTLTELPEVPQSDDGSSTPPTKKYKKANKRDSAIPLPEPFPLQKHYGATIEEALAKKEMTNKTTRAFLSSIAAAILVYKHYPTRSDYEMVAKTNRSLQIHGISHWNTLRNSQIINSHTNTIPCQTYIANTAYVYAY